MRRLALLLAGGALWILFAAAPAFADGGPHTMDINNGSLGLAGDCAACHRAHQATATDLLKASQPGLCLSCHNGLGATADVVDGVQYTPTGGSTYQQTTVLGALRGGGFSYALLNTAAPDRLSYSSRGGITVALNNVPTGGSITLTFGAFTGFGGGSITITGNENATAVQTDATALFGTDGTYSGSTDPIYMSGLPVGDANVVVTKSTNDKTWTFALNNEFRLVDVPLPTVSGTLTYASGNVAVTVSNGVSVGNTARVGVLASGLAVTSTHLGDGTVWGNGAQGVPGAGATGVALECTNCHNPHGNGQYRILDTLPGEDWANGTDGVAGWTDPTVDVEVIDGRPLTTGEVHNYTVKGGYTTADVVVSPTAGDYWRYKWDPSGDTNFTNFYLLKDPMSSGWNGQTATNAASIASIPDKTLGAALGDYTASTGAAVGRLTLNNVTGIPTNSTVAQPQPLFIIKIDNELMTAQIQTLPATGTPTSFSATDLKVSRGQFGTAIVPHLSGATVSIISSDPAVDAVNAPLYNNLGRMTAFCIACHTRYNGWAQNGTSSLNAQTPMDAIFGYKHGTTSTGCEQCHVNHGTNAAMTGVSATVLFPDGTSEDSALLKVNNRGTCQLCHDPTGTIPVGNTEGSVPGSITPQ